MLVFPAQKSMNVCVVISAEKHSPYVNIILLTAPEAFQTLLYLPLQLSFVFGQ